MTYALVVSYSDRSGIQNVWGPFRTEEEAKATAEELADIGVVGQFDAVPLRRLAPVRTQPVRLRPMEAATHGEQILRIDEVAARLRCGRTHVYALIKSGELPAVKEGGRRLVYAEALADYIARLSEQ